MPLDTQLSPATHIDLALKALRSKGDADLDLVRSKAQALLNEVKAQLARPPRDARQIEMPF